MQQKAWSWYAAVGAVAVAFYLSPLVPSVKPVLYDLFGLSAVPAILLGLRWHRPALRALAAAGRGPAAVRAR